jgi:hypothetical protein
MKYLRQYIREVLEASLPVQPNSQIFCDMDGVLVDFETSVVTFINHLLDGGSVPNVKRSKGHFYRLNLIHKEMGKDWRLQTGSDLNLPVIRSFMFISIAANPGAIFASMKPLQDGVDQLWPALNSTDLTVNILSAPINGNKNASTTASAGKKEWVKNWLTPQPSSIVITPARQKSEYANTNGVPNILIDDKTSTIDSWNAAGGIGILHTPGNSTKTITGLKELLK